VAKFLPREDPLRVYVFETDVFRKESELYFDVLPAIKACLRFVTRRSKSLTMEHHILDTNAGKQVS
jgi:hypothetical protein